MSASLRGAQGGRWPIKSYKECEPVAIVLSNPIQSRMLGSEDSTMYHVKRSIQTLENIADIVPFLTLHILQKIYF